MLSHSSQIYPSTAVHHRRWGNICSEPVRHALTVTVTARSCTLALIGHDRKQNEMMAFAAVHVERLRSFTLAGATAIAANVDANNTAAIEFLLGSGAVQASGAYDSPPLARNSCNASI